MRSVPRMVTVLLVVAAVFAAGVALWQSWRSAPSAVAPNQDGWVSTRYGPLGPADRDMVIQVRQAMLWQLPVAQQVAQRAAQASVRDTATRLAADDQVLDTDTRATARDLGIALPTQPSDTQQGWMRDIDSESGDSYDRTAVNQLRAADGDALRLVVAVQVGTRNAQIRGFAADTAADLARHIGALEATGLVDFNALPQPPAPARAVVTSTGQYREVPVALAALGIALLAAALIMLMLRSLPRRRSPVARPATGGHRSRRRRPVPAGPPTDVLRSPR